MKGKTVHKLGLGHGKFVERSGCVTYYPPGPFSLPSFTVRIEDVKHTSMIHHPKGTALLIHGQGTILASARVGVYTARKMSEWFEAHQKETTR